ncbi:unnamed protein product [Arabis nemorensis]|uniref:Uncharacterized protein n=1 Tax=Arabis nemorensis TaxID=586526 RepID=A0A565BWI8_9BRAS|nr:unnamed protein product [Arabis nemorensis]
MVVPMATEAELRRSEMISIVQTQEVAEPILSKITMAEVVLVNMGPKTDGLQLPKAQEGLPLGLNIRLDAQEVISPSKEIMWRPKKENIVDHVVDPENLPKVPRTIEQRIS